MCGIVGFINKNIIEKETIIKSMAEKIKHRGPDGEGYYIDDFIAIGHKRLSIIDINSGKQPIFNENKNLVIVFNGEIYNYKELKKELIKQGHIFKTESDTEVIIHGFEEWKDDVVLKLRGMFAFAIWDKKNKELFIARDPFGIKPLYYGVMNDTFMFASEIKALLKHPSLNKELNDNILVSYLCFNFNPCEETFFKNVYSLSPGYIIKYKDNKIYKKKYFYLDLKEEKTNNTLLLKNIENGLKDSINHHLISDVKVGAFLSSGIDSSLIVALSKVKNTYTVGYKSEKYNEIEKAKKLANDLNINNKSYILSKEEYLQAYKILQYYFDEPLSDPAAIPLYFVSQMAKEDVKVILTGEGADELFGGYLSYKEEINYDWYNKIPYIIRKIASIIIGVFKEKRGLNFIYRRGQKLEDYYIGIGRVFRDKEAKHIVKINKQIKTKNITKNIYKECKGKSNLIKRQTVDFHFWLAKDFLHAIDRVTMMFGIEARTPFLDKKVYRSAKNIPKNLKISNSTTKIALRKIAKKYIREETANRQKLGFPVPLREWIKEDDLYEEIYNKFNTSNAKYFFKVRKIIKLLNDHKNGKKDNYKKIWNIYTFLTWYEIYFDNSKDVIYFDNSKDVCRFDKHK